MNNLKNLLYLSLVLAMGLVVSCSDDEPTPTTEPEETISQVVLTFTPDGGGDAVTATWLDADGDGGDNPSIDNINLQEGVTYVMTMTLANTLASPTEDITAEILEEDNEHQFFFAFTDGIFSNPTGDGNIDNASDAINYNDQDENGLPVGLSTTWTAGAHTDAAGEFRVVLKHQPDLKTADSDFNVGGTDIDIVFPINIAEGDNEEEEVINEVVLTFTPTAGGDPITIRWFDEDGEGAGNPSIDDITLDEGAEYTMAITLANTLGAEVEDVTAEILEEDDEHQFFFGFTDGIFSNPTGDGNIDNRDDAINYADQDENGLPVGLSTTWTAGAHTEQAGTFRVVLKHQPGIKSATSGSDQGGTDIDISFNLNIAEGNEEEETINQVVLTFTPTGGGDAIAVTWFDEDGEGAGNPSIDDINLAADTEYEMSITLTNTLGAENEDVTAEIQEEDDEHMFFFAFTADIFSSPAGDGNVDNRADAVNYNDQDANGNPVGLSTNWTTGSATMNAGDFRVILKHQPGLKTDTSDATVGGTDIDIQFNINIQ